MKNYFIVILIGFALFLAGNQVLAAGTFFQSENNEITAGHSIKINFFLNAENQNLNALEGGITFRPDHITLSEINDGSSIVNFWVKKPQLESDGQIVFSGAIPGGFSESNGFLFSLTFQARDTAITYPRDFEINSQSMAFLNDGKGTEIDIPSSGFHFTVCEKSQENTSENTAASNQDTNPPEVFAPYIIKNPEILDGRWALVYYAQDKGSGISHYEVSETKDKLDLNKISEKNIPWITTDGPYLLEDQELKNYVYVKAVDKAGNEKIAMVLPRETKSFPHHYTYMTIFAIMAIILLIVFIFVCKNRLKANKSE